MIIIGETFIWGIPHEIKPVIGVTGLFRYRLRLRSKGYAKIFVRMPRGVSAYILKVRQDGDWQCGCQLGSNERREVA